MSPSSSGRDSGSPISSSVVRYSLTEGFSYLTTVENRHGMKMLNKTDPNISSVRVDFLDPSGDRGPGLKSYFTLIENIFRREYNFTLRKIPFQSIRSGAITSIDSISIRCIKSGSYTQTLMNSVSTQHSNSSSVSNSMGTPGPASAMSILFGRRGSSDSSAKDTSKQKKETQLHDNDSINHSHRTSRTSASSTESSSSASAPENTTSTANSLSNSDKPDPTESIPSNSNNINPMINDATEWHLGQYCHVYIAACESVDHYKTKVKPCIQAFVSQLESNKKANGSVAGNSGIIGPDGMSQGSTALTSCQYVILYVPVQSQNSTSLSSGVSGLGVRAAASRISKAVRNNTAVSAANSLAGNNSGGDIGDASVHSYITMDHGNHHIGGISQSEVTTLMSSREKEVLKRLSNDFPHGRVCVMSTLPLTDSPNSMSMLSQAQGEIYKKEWKIFMTNLGDAIISGFRDKFKQYDEELRRLDKRRAMATNLSIGSSLKKKIDLTHFFLVKESLAFTYEQMQLYSEALLQYEEFNAVVSSSLWNGGKADKVTNDTELFSAAHGITASFRQKTRANQVTEIEMHHYLFCRETNLLFRMRKPINVISRTYQHILLLYQMNLYLGSDDIHGNDNNNRIINDKIKRAEAEALALCMCWDVKRACDNYFTFCTNEIPSSSGTEGKKDRFKESLKRRASQSMRILGGATGRNNINFAENEREASQKLCSLLEFARLRLLALGDLLLSENPIRLATLQRPLDTYNEWLPWSEIKKNQHESTNNAESESQNFTGNNFSIMDTLEVPCIMNSDWLRESFSSREAYETKYLELSQAIISLYQHAKRPRFTARLLTERAEIFALRKDFRSAVDILIKIVDSSSLRDQLWDRLYFWRLFRLACFQRMSCDSPTAYLRTLVRCFTPRLAVVTPPETRSLFQRDLEALVQEDSVKNCFLNISPLFETEIVVFPNNGNGSTYSQHPLGFLRRKLTKYTCFVGEKMNISVFIVSSLPKTITVDRLRLFLVTFENYEIAYRRSLKNISLGVNIIEEDAYRILTTDHSDGDIKIKPGRNQFLFEWIPMTVGQFAFASMDLKWSNAEFYHNSSTFRRPIQGVQVIPSVPTQAIELSPLFLMPGHEQEVRLSFSSNEDIVTRAKVNFHCSEGLTILIPGANSSDESSWCTSCEVDIEAIKPNSNKLIRTLVRSASISENHEEQRFIGVQSLSANAESFYHHHMYTKLALEENKEPKSRPMKTSLEARVNTLDRPALTVYDVKPVCLSETKVMVSIILHCNTPTPFFLNQWNISFPPPLSLEPEGDLNDGLFGNPIVVGEEIFFGFLCTRLMSDPFSDDISSIADSLKDFPTMDIVLQDDIGKTFHQVLPLDSMEEFYQQMKKEDEYARLNTVSARLSCSAQEGVVGAPVNFQFRVDVSNLRSLEQKILTPTSEKGMTEREGIVAKDKNGRPLILYSTLCNFGDWILSGKVQGTCTEKIEVDTASGKSFFTLDFVGIPTRSGLLANFPELELSFCSLSGNNKNSSSSDINSTSSATTFSREEENEGEEGGGKNNHIPQISVQCVYPDAFQSLSYTYHTALATPLTEFPSSQ